MTPEQRKQIEEKLKKRGFVELSHGKEGMWTYMKIPHMRLVDLTKTSEVKEFAGLPVVCISDGIGGRMEQGHGITEIDDIRMEIAGILKHRGEAKEKEQPAPEVKIVPCRKCGIALSHVWALELFQKNEPAICEECYEKEYRKTKEGKDAKVEEHKANTPEVKPEPKVPEVAQKAFEDSAVKLKKPDVLIPAHTATPQGSFIKGLIPAMKEIGKIKIGTKGEVKTSQKGTQYRSPVKFDHFEIVSVLRDDKGNLILDPVMKELGENIKELDIFLLYNDETLNFMTRYNEYRGGKCLCSGDGVKARILNGDEIECNPDICKSFKEKKCKPNGILNVILTKSPRLGGVYKFRTTSYNSIRSILSSLFFIKSLTGGVLAMIPLKLTVSPMTVQPKDSTTAQTIYVVNVEFAGTVQQLLEKTVEVSKYQSLMRGQIKELEARARVALYAPESEEEGKDIQAEFYPEKQEAKA